MATQLGNPAGPGDALALFTVTSALGETILDRLADWTTDQNLLGWLSIAILIAWLATLAFCCRVWWRAYQNWQTSR